MKISGQYLYGTSNSWQQTLPLARIGSTVFMKLLNSQDQSAQLLFAGETILGKLLNLPHHCVEPGTLVQVKIEGLDENNHLHLRLVADGATTARSYSDADIRALLQQHGMGNTEQNRTIVEHLLTHRLPVCPENIRALQQALSDPTFPRDLTIRSVLFLMERNLPPTPHLTNLLARVLNRERLSGDLWASLQSHLETLSSPALKQAGQQLTGLLDPFVLDGDSPAERLLSPTANTTIPPEHLSQDGMRTAIRYLTNRFASLPEETRSAFPLLDRLVSLPDGSGQPARLPHPGTLDMADGQWKELAREFSRLSQTVVRMDVSRPAGLPQPLAEDLSRRIPQTLRHYQVRESGGSTVSQDVRSLLSSSPLSWGREIRDFLQHILLQSILNRPAVDPLPYAYYQIPLQWQDNSDTLHLFVSEQNHRRQDDLLSGIRMLFCIETRELGLIKTEVRTEQSALSLLISVENEDIRKYVSSRKHLLREFMRSSEIPLGAVQVFIDRRSPFAQMEDSLERPQKVDLYR